MSKLSVKRLDPPYSSRIINFAKVSLCRGQICMPQNDFTDNFNWSAGSRSIRRSMSSEIMWAQFDINQISSLFTIDQAATYEIGKI